MLGENVGLPEAPFVRRWVLDLHFFSIRLHRWLSSDDLRFPHDHSWNFLTMVLRGGYTEHSYSDGGSLEYMGGRIRKAGSVGFRGRNSIHKVEITSDSPCWSLVMTGRWQRMPGFWIRPGKRMKQNKYFFEYGHYDPAGGSPRRTRSHSEGHSETLAR